MVKHPHDQDVGWRLENERKIEAKKQLVVKRYKVKQNETVAEVKGSQILDYQAKNRLFRGVCPVEAYRRWSGEKKGVEMGPGFVHGYLPEPPGILRMLRSVLPKKDIIK